MVLQRIKRISEICFKSVFEFQEKQREIYIDRIVLVSVNCSASLVTNEETIGSLLVSPDAEMTR